jgi:hypothetical protein
VKIVKEPTKLSSVYSRTNRILAALSDNAKVFVTRNGITPWIDAERLKGISGGNVLRFVCHMQATVYRGGAGIIDPPVPPSGLY